MYKASEQASRIVTRVLQGAGGPLPLAVLADRARGTGVDGSEFRDAVRILCENGRLRLLRRGHDMAVSLRD